MPSSGTTADVFNEKPFHRWKRTVLLKGLRYKSNESLMLALTAVVPAAVGERLGRGGFLDVTSVSRMAISTAEQE